MIMSLLKPWMLVDGVLSMHINRTAHTPLSYFFLLFLFRIYRSPLFFVSLYKSFVFSFCYLCFFTIEMLTNFWLVLLYIYTCIIALGYAQTSTFCDANTVCPNLQTCQEHVGSCYPGGCVVYKACTAVENVSTCQESDGTSVSCFPLYCYGGICQKGRHKQLGDQCNSGNECDSYAGLYCDLNNHRCQVRTGPDCRTDNSVCKGNQDCCNGGKCCRSGTCPENGGSCAK